MKKNLIILFLIFLTLGELLFFNNRNKVYKDIISSRSSDLADKTALLYKKDMEDSLITISENLTIKNIKVINKDNETFRIKELIRSPTLIYKFDEQSCRSCVEATLKILNKVHNNIDNIIIISKTFHSSRELSIFIAKNNIKPLCFYSEESFDIPIDSSNDFILEKSYMFLLDENLKVHYPIIVHSKNDEKWFYYKLIHQIINDSSF
jgi:hypothetical protein